MIEIRFYEMVYLILFGFFVGVVGSVLGIGGGAFIVPFLVMIFKLPIKYAIASSLVSIVATSTAVASVNVERGLANIRLGVMLELTMALGSVVSTYIMITLKSSLLQLLFAFMLLPTSLSMYLKSRAKNVDENYYVDEKEVYSYYDYSSKKHIRYSILSKGKASIFSFFAGMLSGFFGLGGGLIQVPVVNIICKVPMKVATATSNFMIGLSSSASALILWRKGYVIEDVVIFLIVGVLVGSVFGMRVLYKAKNSTIQLIFSVLLMIVSLKMIYEVFR